MERGYEDAAWLARREGPQPMGWLLSYHAFRDPHRPAITIDDRTLTRIELDRAANRMARALEAEGVAQDDLVPLMIRPGFEPHILSYALWKLGATPVPVSPRFAPGELAGLLDLLSPRIVLSAMADEVGGRRSTPPGFTPDPMLADTPLPERTAASLKGVPSGGSTGRPKIVVATQPSVQDPHNLWAPYRMTIDDIIYQPCVLHQNSAYALVHFGLAWGAHMVRTEKFDPEGWLAAIERHKVRFAFAVPTMMNRIWKLGRDVLDRYDLSSLECVMHSTAPCPPWLKRAWIDWLGPDRILEMYGGTEANGGALIGGDEWLERPGSVGRPFNETLILDEAGRPLPPGEVGEIFFRPPGGPGSTFRYIGGETRVKGERESLGDMGWMDEAGYLYLADRRTDMMIVGGTNIYPAEIEAALDAHPAIASSVVVARPDADMGSRPHAVIELRAGVDAPDAAELAAFLRGRLASIKMPHSFEVTRDQVRDDGGKVRRATFRDRLLDRLAQGREFDRLR